MFWGWKLLGSEVFSLTAGSIIWRCLFVKVWKWKWMCESESGKCSHWQQVQSIFVVCLHRQVLVVNGEHWWFSSTREDSWAYLIPNRDSLVSCEVKPHRVDSIAGVGQRGHSGEVGHLCQRGRPGAHFGEVTLLWPLLYSSSISISTFIWEEPLPGATGLPQGWLRPGWLERLLAWDLAGGAGWPYHYILLKVVHK